MLTLRQIRFCAEEVERQECGPLSVADMCAAFSCAAALARVVVPRINNLLISRLGTLIEPTKNQNGFRNTPVVLNNVPALPHGQIVRALNNLNDAIENGAITPLDYYVEFEKIHPFRDGNGRVGAILYNMILGTLDNPTCPPNMF